MCQLLAAAGASRDAPRWTLAAVLGRRQGEVLGLQWDYIDLKGEGTVAVRRQLQRLAVESAAGRRALVPNRRAPGTAPP